MLAAARQRLRDSRRSRAQRMVASLEQAGTGVTWEQVQALAAGGTVGRPHVAQALVGPGWCPPSREAFVPEWLGTRPALCRQAELDVFEAVRRWSGGRRGRASSPTPAPSARGRTVRRRA